MEVKPLAVGNCRASQGRYRLFVTVESVLLLITVLGLAGLFGQSIARLLLALFGFLLLWHLIAIPICFMYLFGTPIVMSLSPLIDSAESRAFRRQLKERPALSDDDFYALFYGGSGIPRDIPARLRHALLSADPLFERAIPSDVLYHLYDDLDIADVVDFVEMEFGIAFTKADHRGIDGTFDNLVQLVRRRTNHEYR
jgi:hypothetical protein